MKFSITSVLATALAAQQAQATFLSPELIIYNIKEISHLLGEAANIIESLNGSNVLSVGPVSANTGAMAFPGSQSNI